MKSYLDLLGRKQITINPEQGFMFMLEVDLFVS